MKGKRMSQRNQFEARQWFTARIFTGGGSVDHEALGQFMYEATGGKRDEAIGLVLSRLRQHHEVVKSRFLGLEEAIQELESGLLNG